MAATIKTRFQLKNETEENWNKSSFIPLKGEPVIYSTDATHPFFRIKIGDGVTGVTELPFVNAETVGTIASWAANADYIPADGEIIIYSNKDVVNNTNIPGLKIGDGVTAVGTLPFISAGYATKLQHTLTFGSNQNYTFDGSADVVVPVYPGSFF